MTKKEFRKRIFACLKHSEKEIRWQIENAIVNGIYKECDENFGSYSDVKAILYAVLETSAEYTIGTPPLPDSTRRFNKMRKKFRWQFFH